MIDNFAYIMQWEKIFLYNVFTITHVNIKYSTLITDKDATTENTWNSDGSFNADGHHGLHY
jgi:hypothetical protein